MNNFTQLQNEVIALLSGAPALSGVRFVPEFPAGAKPTPVRGTTVAVGIGSVRCEKGGFGDYLGVRDDGSAYGRKLSVTLRFFIYSQSGTASECSDVFFEIIQTLLFGSELSFTELSCDSPSFDKDLQTVMLTAKAVCSAVLVSGTQEAGFSDFSVRREVQE